MVDYDISGDRDFGCGIRLISVFGWHEADYRGIWVRDRGGDVGDFVIRPGGESTTPTSANVFPAIAVR